MTIALFIPRQDRCLGGAVLVALSAIVCSPAVAAQQTEAPPPDAQSLQEDTVQLVFEREVFSYPSHARRNPFRQLTGVGDMGPRFEQLSLLGVIVSSAPGGSVALLGVAGAEQASERTQRLRVGDRLGNVRVLAIRPREIDVEVEEFGLRERATMQLRRSAPQASPGEPEDIDVPSEAEAGDDGDGEPSPTQGDTITPPPDTMSSADDGSGGDADTGGSGAGSDDSVGLNGKGGT